MGEQFRICSPIYVCFMDIEETAGAGDEALQERCTTIQPPDTAAMHVLRFMAQVLLDLSSGYLNDLVVLVRFGFDETRELRR